MRHPFALLCLLSAGLGACGDGTTRSDPAVRDSAGVRIVENGAPDAVPAWSLAADPEWSVGEVTLASGEIHPLAGVLDVERLDDGRIAVVEGSTGSLLLGRPGEAWQILGGRGEGPDEFGRLSAVELAGDSVLALDAKRWEIRVYDEEGAPLGQIALPAPQAPGMVPVIARAGGRNHVLLMSGLPGGPTEGPYRGVGPVLRMDGASLDTLTLVPGAETFASQQAMGFVLLGARSYAAGSDAGLWLADTERPEVALWTRADSPTLVARWTPPASPPLESLRGDIIDAMLSATPEERRAAARGFMDAVPVADDVPSFRDLVGADGGGVWVGPFSPPELEALEMPRPAGEWLAFEANGVLEARVALPAGLQPQVIGPDFVIAVHTDELGVESIRRYGIVR